MVEELRTDWIKVDRGKRRDSKKSRQYFNGYFSLV